MYKENVTVPQTSDKPLSYRKVVYCTSIKVFNILPKCIADLMDDKK
jgi:hypothetical protein